jgi:hypothetical protein
VDANKGAQQERMLSLAERYSVSILPITCFHKKPKQAILKSISFGPIHSNDDMRISSIALSSLLADIASIDLMIISP